MKKMLMLATTAAMIEQFNKNNILILEDMGYEIHVIGNWKQGNPISDKRLEEFKVWLSKHHGKWFHMPSTRKPTDLYNNIKAYKLAVKLIEQEHYDFIHCHTPIGSVIGRCAAHKTRTKVIYTAHGFHFYKGASKKNWLLFYPIERFFSRITDVLITINEEDYRLAKRKFKAKEVYRIPGIGVNEERLQLNNFDANMYRLKLGVKKEDYMVLSVGELNNNKNHSLIIKAIAEMKDASVHYFIAGVGENKEKYEKLIEELEIEGQIHLLGFRTDIAELNHCADVFAFPSIREGLGMAALEALTCGTPVCGMDTRGINEYVVNGKTGYLFSNNVEDCKNSLIKVKGKETDMRQACIEMSKNYYKEKTNDIMKLIYERNAV